LDKYSMFQDKVDLRPFVKVVHDQGTIECCTASAVLHAIEIMSNMKFKFSYLSRLFVYYMTRKLQDRLGQHGAELGKTFEALQIYGVCDEKLWPFTFLSWNSPPSLTAEHDAAYRKVLSYRQIDIDEFKFKKELTDHRPVVIGMITGSLFWKLSGKFEDLEYVPVNGTTNRQSKSHAVVIVGFDDTLRGGSFIVMNSKGPRWGDHGYAPIPYSCLVDIGEAYVVDNFSGWEKISTN